MRLNKETSSKTVSIFMDTELNMHVLSYNTTMIHRTRAASISLVSFKFQTLFQQDTRLHDFGITQCKLIFRLATLYVKLRIQ